MWEMSRLLFSRQWRSLSYVFNICWKMLIRSVHSAQVGKGGGEEVVPINGALNLQSLATLFYTP